MAAKQIKKRSIIKQSSYPQEMTTLYLECVILANGEIISKGKSLGYFKQFQDVLFRLD